MALRLGPRMVRQELLDACWDRQFVPAFTGILDSIALQVTDRGQALRRGEVLAFGGEPLWEGVETDSLYCAQPAYFPEELSVWRGSTPPTAVVWLIPIHREEADFVTSAGWEAFEDLFERVDPDLLDLRRPPIV